MKMTTPTLVVTVMLAMTAMGSGMVSAELVSAEVSAAFALHPLRQNVTGTCGVCLDVVEEISSVLLANSTQADATKELDKLCALLPDGTGEIGALCDKLAAAIDSALWGFAHETSFPSVVCGEIEVCAFACCTPGEYEQVHLSYDPAAGMVVNWATLAATSRSVVRYGLAPNALNASVVGGKDATTTYTFAGWRGVLHHVAIGLESLPPGQLVYYAVGDGQTWSDQTFHFRVPRALDDPHGVAVLYIGDMGVHNSKETMARLVAEVATGKWDLLVHNGDISYADGQQPLWDEYMRRIQPFAAYIPMMVSPGNHDCPGRFASYTARFASMPATSPDSPLYYSFAYRHLNFLMMATDFPNDDPFWPDGTAAFKPGTPQGSWIAKQLDAFASQTSSSWLIVSGHRPLYCTSASNGDWADCLLHAPLYRSWWEDAFKNATVDIVFQSHEHAYQRFFPVYHNQLVSTSYQSPSVPIYLVNGAAGNIEGHAPVYQSPRPPFSAFQDGTEYGYARAVFSGPQSDVQTMMFEFVSASTGLVVDSFTLTK